MWKKMQLGLKIKWERFKECKAIIATYSSYLSIYMITLSIVTYISTALRALRPALACNNSHFILLFI